MPEISYATSMYNSKQTWADGLPPKSEVRHAIRSEKGRPMEDDARFMQRAIVLSAAAAEHGNEPFGAVLVKDGRIVFENENQIYTLRDPTFHGEAGLIRRFCSETGICDLRDYTLYSSCEPCFMCSGAMVWAKLGRLVYAASNIDLEDILGKVGCNCSEIVFTHSTWKPRVTSGILRSEAMEVLRAYFDDRRAV